MSTIDFSALDALDQRDPLADKRQLFIIPEDTVYLDGNSLGLLTHATQQRVAEVTRQQWGQDAISSWNKHQWVHLPRLVGDKLAPIIGAAAGQVICCDSISVNLFKALSAALHLQRQRGEQQRTKVISTRDNFPTDLYMVQGLEQLLGAQHCHLQMVEEADLLSAAEDLFDAETAILLVTEVNFRSGRRLPVAELIRKAHAAGVLVIVDLAHSAGAMPVLLDEWQADFAVGCTYKYLNGGPGAPAFVYVAQRHLGQFVQPLAGWFGHAQPFAFEPTYQPAPGIEIMLSGTPSVLTMAAVDSALDAFAGVDLAVVREKSLALAETFLQQLEACGIAAEFDCISPPAAERGSQLSFAHPQAYAICQALIDAKVVADFRAPHYLRVGFTPLYTSFFDIGVAVERLTHIMRKQTYLQPQYQKRHAVT
jgi:kynureninase